MRRKPTIVVFAIAAGLVFLAPASAGASDHDRSRDRERGGFVVACDLSGVNPAYHPEIFGNPAVARSYGFVRGRDGTWQVMPNCRSR